MKNTAALAGAAIAALMLGGVAHAQSGNLGLSYQNTDVGGGDLDSIALSGAFLLGDHVQLNGRYADIEIGSTELDYWAIDAFLFNRTDGGAYGGFLGYDTFDAGPSIEEWSVGGFGQLYSGNTTWSAQLGYADTEGDIQVLHLDGEARHFLTENFSVQGNLGFGNIEASGGGGDDFWSGGLGAEWQFGGAPFSIYAGWRHIDFDGGESDQLGVGGRWNFGGGTLLERNRSGASMARVTPTLFELELGGGVAPR